MVWKKIEVPKDFENIKVNDSWILKYTGEEQPVYPFSYSEPEYSLYTVAAISRDNIDLRPATSMVPIPSWDINMGIRHNRIKKMVGEGIWWYLV
jgi:hypothetical protein